MNSEVFSYAIVLPTLGRKDEVVRLLTSLLAQTLPPKQIIIVDQNSPTFLTGAVTSLNSNLIDHNHVDWQGLSRARNYGLRKVKCKYVLFADDDSEFPENTFENCAKFLRNKSLDCLAMHLCDKNTGETMLNYPSQSCHVKMNNIHSTTCEGATLWQHDTLIELGGYDEDMGLGRFYSAEEGADLVFRALRHKANIEYDASIKVFHPSQRNAEPLRFLRYARGSGYLLRKHLNAWPIWRLSMIFLIKNIIGTVIFIHKTQKRTKHWYRLKGFFEGFFKKNSDSTS